MQELPIVSVGDRAIGRIYAPLLSKRIKISFANKDECAKLLQSQVGAVCIIHSYTEDSETGEVSICLKPSDGVQWEGIISQAEYDRE